MADNMASLMLNLSCILIKIYSRSFCIGGLVLSISPIEVIVGWGKIFLTLRIAGKTEDLLSEKPLLVTSSFG